MNFDYSEDQLMIQKMTQDFAKKEILPNINVWDEKQYFPIELFKKAGQQGLMGVLVPEKFGGSGLGYEEYILVIKEISKVCGAIGLSLAAHNSLCVNHLLKFGNDNQKNKWLPKLSSGQWIGAWGLTEPNTGSDAMRMKCVAEQDGDYWVINGSKNFITHGISGDIIVVIVRTGDLLDSHGMTAFAVERGTKGFLSGKKENKLGMRASETAEVIFDNCRVHKENIIGNIGEGFIQSMKILDGGRISIGAMALGMAEGALEASISYSKEREQFGKPISKFQGISFKLAEMATEIEASKMLLFKAASRMLSNSKDANYHSAIAKFKASEVAVSVANDAVQIFGGYGYSKEYPVEKFYRDSKLSTIGEGTSEIQKLVISRALLNN
ncbi:MAG: acyl-CoA dehydrogenase family protein [Flavobacteriales bacterium]|nr:acyl-CoA dehydrogenase family protein [Flavobacteriales bacterium]MBL6868598.1 acyl-CoA dehydrogenase family protein [Flavobacteriales bacterium]CAI8174036.1 MAG: Acyl-CoA dehydrogenase [Crocinitomicaceae bacterium]|tara:strand:+ start:8246 stop:9391 length:1146 start_codon:yes stop_codon:yes gene_type:complete